MGAKRKINKNKSWLKLDFTNRFYLFANEDFKNKFAELNEKKFLSLMNKSYHTLYVRFKIYQFNYLYWKTYVLKNPVSKEKKKNRSILNDWS